MTQGWLPGWMPPWDMWGDLLCSFPRKEAKNTNWWTLNFGVAHQLSVLGTEDVLKGERDLQVMACASLMVKHGQLVLIPLF